MANRVSHQEIVRKVVEAKAIDFNAIGKVFAEVGPSLSLADEPWESFCGTMRSFIRMYKLTGDIGGPVEELGALRGIAGELTK